MLKYNCFILTLCLFSLWNINCESNKLDEEDMINDPLKQINFMEQLIPDKSQIGQIGGIDTDSNGNLVVFHRAYRKWSWDSFINDVFNVHKYGVIKADVLSLVNVKKLEVMESWGSGKFYMPHGLTVDHNNNIWLTDVGLHQVFKFNLQNSQEPLLTLGTRFLKSTGKNSFCKPTSVAISEKNEDIFVADGYCNSRVSQFNKDGEFIKEYTDAEQPLIVVHSIALLEDKNLVCTVSREEGRIVCFDIDSGEKKFTVINELMNTVYAIKYDKLNQVIHAATGSNSGLTPLGLTFDAKLDSFGNFIQKWEPKNGNLKEAHAIAMSPDSENIYVGQLNGEIDQFIFI